MIDWVHDLGKDWGRWMRRNPNWAYKSLAGTVAEYGSVGAAIKSHEQVIPYHPPPADIREFHYAWEVSQPRVKLTTYTVYALIGSMDEKANALGIDRSTLFRRLTDVHAQLWSTMDLQSRVAKVVVVAARN